MYVWIGCKLPESFEQKIRSRCLELNEDIGLDTVAFSLPQHISLKISFACEKYVPVLDALTGFLSEQKPFAVQIGDPSQNGNILWLPAAENSVLRQLHDRLDTLLETGFGIPRHPFDKAFLFHSTLFIDDDREKIAKMREALASCPIARSLTVDTFLLGVSETGKPGSYRVIRQIQV